MWGLIVSVPDHCLSFYCDRHMRNVLMDEQHDPSTMDISVFSIYTIWASFREEL